ncbi:hypothetical protein ZTR_09026 [Talaromyces verruculosus]|nr:hypothetical protein ZTR_09026 [Talaromyces verruculosus]
MVIFRIIGGLLNGTVGVVRTMLSENIVEKQFQSRAFSLLSLSFNVASFLGPLIAGFLSSPQKINATPKARPITLLEWYPYALPLLINAGALFLLTVVVFFHLEETSQNLSQDVYRLLRYKILTHLRVPRGSPGQSYNALGTEDTEADDLREFPVSSPTVHSHVVKSSARTMSLCTFTFIMTLTSQSVFDFHMGAYTGLWPLFLSNPRENTDIESTSKSGGLGLSIEDVGVATSIAGAIGMFIQILIYPQINDIIGVVNSYRYFSCLFPLSYFALPLLGLIPETATVTIWAAIFLTLMIHVTGRVFVIPATLIVLNNSAPSPELLGKVHGIGQMASSLFRTLGPFFAGYLYQASLQLQSIIFAWWVVAGLAIVGFCAAQYVRDGPVPITPTRP